MRCADRKRGHAAVMSLASKRIGTDARSLTRLAAHYRALLSLVLTKMLLNAATY